MAVLGLLDKFNGVHGTKEIRKTVFSVEATLEGRVERDFVGGIDYLDPRKKLRSVLDELEGRYLDDIVGRATVENIALYMLFNLGASEFTSVRVTEGTSQYVTVFPGDIPEDYPTRRLFGVAASKLVRGEFQEACDGFTKVLEINPKMAEAYNCRGLCFRSMNNPDLALKDFDKAVEIQPEFSPAFNNRGLSLRHLKRHKEAIESYKKAIELDPTYTEAYFDLAKTYEEIGEAKLFQECMSKAGHPNQDPWRKITYPK